MDNNFIVILWLTNPKHARYEIKFQLALRQTCLQSNKSYIGLKDKGQS